MHKSHLTFLILLVWALAACDGSAPGAELTSQAPSQPTLEAAPTLYIPPERTPTIPILTTLAPQGDVIGIANAQALRVDAQVVESQAQSFSWLPGGEQVALAVDQGIMVYAVQPATIVDHLEGVQPSKLTISGQTPWLAWVSAENTIQVLDTQEQRQVAEIKSPAGAVTSLSLAAQGGKLAFATFDQHVQVWADQAGSLRLFKDWQLPFWLANLSFSPDGNILAGADLTNFTVHFFDLASGEEIRTFEWNDHASPALYGVEFSPDWMYLAWTARGSVLLMDVASGETQATLQHEDFVSATAWSLDGSLLATAAAGTLNGQFGPFVYLWEAASGRLINQLGQAGGVLSMSFSPDGSELAVLTSGGALQVWSVAP